MINKQLENIISKYKITKTNNYYLWDQYSYAK